MAKSKIEETKCLFGVCLKAAWTQGEGEYIYFTSIKDDAIEVARDIAIEFQETAIIIECKPQSFLDPAPVINPWNGE